MNCLFCKKASDGSKSVEHIIPESLGNTDHVLPKGLVCDDCNNYFATKIERVLLDQPYFRSVRHRCQIESKKGIIPFEKVIQVKPFLAPLELHFVDGERVLNYREQDVGKMLHAKSGAFIIPMFDGPEDNNVILSRFLAKTSLEALVYWIKNESEWIQEVMEKPELEDIKRYARYGAKVKYWPYHQRRIYFEEDCFYNPEIMKEPYEVLHEFKFMWTKEMEFYFVIAIMGIEYAINMGEPSVDTYKLWLKENDGKSILESADEKRVRSKSLK